MKHAEFEAKFSQYLDIAEQNPQSSLLERGSVELRLSKMADELTSARLIFPPLSLETDDGITGASCAYLLIQTFLEEGDVQTWLRDSIGKLKQDRGYLASYPGCEVALYALDRMFQLEVHFLNPAISS